jgi:hypothetical protein
VRGVGSIKIGLWLKIGKKVIFSDETQVVLGTDHKVYVWRKADEKWRPECLGLRSARNGGVRIFVSFWGCICYSGVGLLTPVDGKVHYSFRQ